MHIYILTRAFLSAPIIGRVHYDELLGYYQSHTDALEALRWDCDDKCGVGLWHLVERKEGETVYPLGDIQYTWHISPVFVTTPEEQSSLRNVRYGIELLAEVI